MVKNMQIGAIIENGPRDWQIIQMVNGKVDISVSGSWIFTEPIINPMVYVRIGQWKNC